MKAVQISLLAKLYEAVLVKYLFINIFAIRSELPNLAVHHLPTARSRSKGDLKRKKERPCKYLDESCTLRLYFDAGRGISWRCIHFVLRGILDPRFKIFD